MSLMSKYNMITISTSREEDELTLDNYKSKIIRLIDENIQIISTTEGWNSKNRMKKMLTDGDYKTTFSLRTNAKIIKRMSGLYLPENTQKLLFLQDAKESVQKGEFDSDILIFLEKEKKSIQERKDEARERRKARQEDERKRKSEEAKKLIHETANHLQFSC